MSRKKEYEEKEKHGTAQFPVGLHKLTYPAGTDVIFIFIGIRNLNFWCLQREKFYLP